MKAKNFFLVSATCLATVAGCAADTSDDGATDATASNDLTGTKPAAAVRKELLPVVRIFVPDVGSCVAVKVGPRHFLTAAQCAVRDINGGGYTTTATKGGTLEVFTFGEDDTDPSVQKYRTPKIDHVVFDNAFADACGIPGLQRSGGFGDAFPCRTPEFLKNAFTRREPVSDLALIVVRDVASGPTSVRDIPSLRVSGRRPTEGQAVTVGGYDGWPRPDFRVGTASVLGPVSASGSVATDLGILGARFLFSTPSTVGAGHPGLPGSPLLVKRNGTWMVAGIRSSGGTPPATGTGAYLSSWFARVDNASTIQPARSVRLATTPASVGVIDWLTAEGAWVTP
jgi:hypothetical protein